MKVKVVHADGRQEVLTLRGPISELHDSPIQVNGQVRQQNWFTDASGTDFYFNLDGTYDGWGRGVGAGLTMDDAKRAIETMEVTREVDADGE